jgi:hypothetical protein
MGYGYKATLKKCQATCFGSTILKVVPFLGSEFFTKIFPAWYSSTIRLERESPSPHPLLFEV